MVDGQQSMILSESTKSAQLGQAACPSGVSTLPNMGKHVAPIGQDLCQAVAQKVDVAISIFLSSEYHSSDFLSPDNFYLVFKPSRQSADSCQVVNYLFIRILPRKTRWSDSFFENS